MATRCPPLRQAQGTRLNTIIEETRETESNDGRPEGSPAKPTSPPQLKLQTTGLNAASFRRNRPVSPPSSSCSDTEWQHQMQGLDELYDATDFESEMSDESMSFSSSQPVSAVTPTATRDSTSPMSRNRLPSLSIPPPHTWSSIQGAPKNSPVPPTPPPKIPVSPAALSKLTYPVPAVHAPPSLDGSVSSDQVSGNSAPATPDLQSVPDDDWNSQELQIQLDLDLEDNQNADNPDPDAGSDPQNIETAIEDTDEDWHRILGNFPAIPSRAHPHTSTTLSLELDAEPAREPTPSDRGIDLPEDALAILRHIHLDGTPEPWSETSEDHEEMWQVDPSQGCSLSVGDATPSSTLSGYSFSSLSIPSPGGFFATLTPPARHTWSIPRDGKAPSSATAEDFYYLPFDQHDNGETVEQVIECPERSPEEGELTAVPAPDGPPTAVRIPPEVASPSPVSPTADAISEIPGAACVSANTEYDEHYHEELQQKALASLDRTSVWLAAQESYLSALRETNPVNSTNNESRQVLDAVDDGEGRKCSETNHEESAHVAETLPEPASSHPSATASKDSIYWRGFQFLRQCAGQQDNFMHRNVRFDAIQSIRLGLTKTHTNRLSGNYELVHHERPPYKGPFSQAPRHSTLMSILTEKAQFSLLEKEQLVLAQIQQSLWAMDSLRYLNGGRLLASPSSQRLSKAAITTGSPNSKSMRRWRILDLGGHASCEWGWYLAHDHPNVSVYTVFTEQQKVNPGIKGPANHRQLSVSQLWKLPFGDKKFDVISVRSLPALLKAERPVGHDQDEYDLCLKECYRCLKPGGYIEFFTMDAEIARAGPYASATSVEFAFNLKSRGYDPIPTKNFLNRLRKANLVGIKRAWMFLPMGVEPVRRAPPRTPDPHAKCVPKVTSPNGSTADIASLSGLFGGWMWEQWLLKLQMEMGRDGDRLLEGIGSVFDEGRKNGAGWTCLSGWAMKPKRKQTYSHGSGKWSF